MIIVGGTYHEACHEPYWNEIYGSGLRACIAILELDPKAEIAFHTFADRNTTSHLNLISATYSNRVKINTTSIPKTPIFFYDHNPLVSPQIIPRLDVLKGGIMPQINGKDILIYGMLEGNAVVNGENVVYDPQSPINPLRFTSNGSKAQKLIYVVNNSEAKLVTGESDPITIRDFLYKEEGCVGLVLKMGAKGALVFDELKDPVTIPVYETDKVWPIGSGDVFSSILSFHWLKGQSLSESASIASKATALFCNSKSLSLGNGLSNFPFKALSVNKFPSKQIYLAGPFFTLTQRWLVSQIRSNLSGMGLKVFSPFHDVGYGSADDVVEKDIEALNDSGLVFAICDGLDSGTIFEVGYAIAKNIPVIVFNQNETSESMKMLEGTKCFIEADLTTAIYKAFWLLAKNE